jgi:hypothetical protein
LLFCSAPLEKDRGMTSRRTLQLPSLVLLVVVFRVGAGGWLPSGAVTLAP